MNVSLGPSIGEKLHSHTDPMGSVSSRAVSLRSNLSLGYQLDIVLGPIFHVECDEQLILSIRVVENDAFYESRV